MTNLFLLTEKFDEAQALRTELSKKQQVCLRICHFSPFSEVYFNLGGDSKSSGCLRYGKEAPDQAVIRGAHLVLYSRQGLPRCNGKHWVYHYGCCYVCLGGSECGHFDDRGPTKIAGYFTGHISHYHPVKHSS